MLLPIPHIVVPTIHQIIVWWKINLTFTFTIGFLLILMSKAQKIVQTFFLGYNSLI